jgi:TPP-dependent trihydroxycyclohexane-1,2-dione (THcHDO) dehydratase
MAARASGGHGCASALQRSIHMIVLLIAELNRSCCCITLIQLNHGGDSFFDKVGSMVSKRDNSFS